MATRSGENLITPKLLKGVESAFSDSFALTIFDLKNTLKLDDYTAIFQLIDRGFLYFCREEVLLSEPRNVVVTKTQAQLLLVQSMLGENNFVLGGNGSISEAHVPGAYAAGRALARLEALKSGFSSRSIRRWRKLLENLGNGISEFQALIPRNFLSGNRTRKINIVVQKCLDDYFSTDHGKRKNANEYRSYTMYRAYAEESHPQFSPVSRTTFARYLRADRKSIAKDRGGVRAANAAAGPSDPSERGLKAEVAWQTAMIDHCLAKIWLVCVSSDNSIYVMRPWVTILIDVATKVKLAIVISFQPPSKTACAKVIRECVRRHGCLPREIYVDRGSDFKSVYFFSVLAHYKVKLSLRPKSHPRYGSEIEQTFAEIQSMWMNLLPGSAVGGKSIRAVDSDFSPQKTAVMQPIDFISELRRYCAWSDANPRGTHGESALARLQKDVKHFPFLPIPVEYNEEFLIMTAIDEKKLKIDFVRGLNVDGLHYWNQQIAQLEGIKTHLDSRIDPENPHCIYALVFDKWVVCHTGSFNGFLAKSAAQQEVDGVLIRDAKAARALVKKDADLQLAKQVRKLELNGYSSAETGREEESISDNDDVYGKIDVKSISELSSEEWGE